MSSSRVGLYLIIYSTSYYFQPYLMRTHNVSADEKSGKALFDLVTADIKWSENKYGLSIIGVCSDDGGDARKMRRLLLELMPWLIVVLCWAHQINLMVGDFLRLESRFLECVLVAQEVVQWMNSHSRALGIFRNEQRQTHPLKKVLTLIRPVITRWTAHYLSLRRLLDVQILLQTCWMKHGATIIESAGSTAEANAKAKSIERTITDPIFWKEVKM